MCSYERTDTCVPVHMPLCVNMDISSIHNNCTGRMYS